MQKIKIILFLLTGLVMIGADLIIHESGHVLMALFFGGRVLSIHLMSFQIFPTLAYHGFNGYLGQVVYSGVSQGTAYGWVTLMGAGATWLASLIFLAVLYFLTVSKVRNFVLFTIALFGSLMFLDMLTYIAGLRFTGLREPLVAAQKLGWDPEIFTLGMLALGTIQLALVIRNLTVSGYFVFFLSDKTEK